MFKRTMFTLLVFATVVIGSLAASTTADAQVFRGGWYSGPYSTYYAPPAYSYYYAPPYRTWYRPYTYYATPTYGPTDYYYYGARPLIEVYYR